MAAKANSGQRIFRDLVLGTLVYSVVLGLFEDYTDILHTWSYSVTFAAAIVMQILTFATLELKSLAVRFFRRRDGKVYVAAMAFSVWLIMFLSKFVFLYVLERIFGGAVELSGFFGLMALIIIATVLTNVVIGLHDRVLAAERPA